MPPPRPAALGAILAIAVLWPVCSQDTPLPVLQSSDLWRQRACTTRQALCADRHLANLAARVGRAERRGALVVAVVPSWERGAPVPSLA